MSGRPSPLDEIKAVVERAEKPAPKMVNIPFDASAEYVRMYHALKELAVRGCSHLVPPSTCRGRAGEPRDRWCEGCIAAEGLGLDREWFQLR